MVVIKDEAWRVNGGTTLFSICFWGILHVDVTTFMLRKYIQKTKTCSNVIILHKKSLDDTLYLAAVILWFLIYIPIEILRYSYLCYCSAL